MHDLVHDHRQPRDDCAHHARLTIAGGRLVSVCERCGQWIPTPRDVLARLGIQP